MSLSAISNLTSAATNSMRERKASVSATPHYITQGLSVHTVQTPDEAPSVPSSGGGGLGSYFSLSRQPSSGSRPLSRRPSLTSSGSAPSTISDLTSSAASTFSLKLSHPRTPSGAQTKMFARANSGAAPPIPASSGMGSIPAAPTSPNGLYVTVHETCTKRIATLDYLRRAHEGRVYFFNVVLMSRPELQKLVYPDVKKLQKKATNFFMLGNSLPSILELGTTTPLDYLRAFNLLLQEFETHIALPPSRQLTTRVHSSSISLGSGNGGGGGNSTLRSMSLPKFFHRSGHTVKPRRGSSATNTSVPDPLGLERTRSSSNSSGSGPTISAPTIPGEDTLPPLPISLPATPIGGIPGEEYMYLATPALPFEPDYFETFATLCDVLIDVYSRVLSLVNGPSLCGPGVGELFLKADAKIRRIVIACTVREWEEAVRNGVKREVGGVAKEVLGGML